MTPRKKAQDLLYKFWRSVDISQDEAKQCAIIAVDEILNSDNDLIQTQPQYDYWQEVKQEIENL